MGCKVRVRRLQCVTRTRQPARVGHAFVGFRLTGWSTDKGGVVYLQDAGQRYTGKRTRGPRPTSTG